MTRRRLAALAIGMLAASLVPVACAPAQVDPHAGEPLALGDYELTFDEPFDRLDVSPWGPGTRWIAHTPWAGDFGDASFIDPQPGAPFSVAGGLLQIVMRRRGGRWTSGLLASSDLAGHGFMQAGGYFEMRARLPGGPGVWPAFWLAGNAPAGQVNPEIDVIEYYGQFPAQYKATTHRWLNGQNVSGTAYDVRVAPHELESGFHTFGVAIDARQVIFYRDRREVAREASQPDYLRPMVIMVDLAAGGGWPIDGMPDPSILTVDYIRAYRHKPAGMR